MPTDDASLYDIVLAVNLLRNSHGEPLPPVKLEGLHDLAYRTGHSERTLTEGASDQKHTGHFMPRPDQSAPLLMGRIVYSLPYANWYRVQLEGLNSDLGCCRAVPASCSPLGTRDQNVLPPGEQVLVYCPRALPFGIILGSIPQIVTHPEINFGDYLVQASNGGITRDAYFRDLNKLTRSGALDFSLGSAVDAASLGEASWLSSLGSGLHLGALLAFLRIDEFCGLFLHYPDKLARLAGYNLDLRTAISELQARQDENEAYYFQGYAAYPWEALGMFQPQSEAFRENSDDDVLYNKCESKLEPKEFLQAPFWRLRDFRGYLGQGFWREVVLPPEGADERTEPWVLGDAAEPRGVFREHVALDGAYFLASAHSLTFVKRLLLPVPVQQRLPEDPQGDRGSGYLFSGLSGSDSGESGEEGGESPKPPRVDEPRMQGEDDQPLDELFPLAWLDWQQFGSNWRSLHQFYYHEKDWRVLEESQADYPNFVPPQIEVLLNQPTVPVPEPRLWTVDHRQTEERYFPTCSGFSILPNGYLVFQGPAGEQLILGGGHVRIHCPGDIELCPGRKLITASGDDTIIKAHQSLDLTSSQGDVRLKAEYNLEMLAGNSGQTGRLLLETKSQGTAHDYKKKFGEDIPGTGIILRADDSEVVAYGGRIYLRSVDGPILLEAGDSGQDTVCILAGQIKGHLQNEVLFAFPNSDQPQQLCRFSATDSMLPGSLSTGGALTARGNLTLTGNISLLNGYIISTRCGPIIYNCDTAPYAYDQISEFLEQQQQRLQDMKDVLKEDYQKGISTSFREETGAGSQDFREYAHFSLRTESQYGVKPDHPLLQPVWQALVQPDQFIKWEEPPVEYQGEKLRPYPGFKVWEGENLHGIEWSLIDPEQGVGLDRDPEAYGQGDVLKAKPPLACKEWLTIVSENTEEEDQTDSGGDAGSDAAPGDSSDTGDSDADTT